jgi:hypothetical protein
VLRQEYGTDPPRRRQREPGPHAAIAEETLRATTDGAVPTALVGMMESFNRALPPPEQAVYVKQLHADDALPECLRDGGTAERHPRARSSRVAASGGCCARTGPDCLVLVPGRRWPIFLGGVNYPMPRCRSAPRPGRRMARDLPRRPFLPRQRRAALRHADKEAYLPTLEKADLFVPRALIDQRREAAWRPASPSAWRAGTRRASSCCPGTMRLLGREEQVRAAARGVSYAGRARRVGRRTLRDPSCARPAPPSM